MTKIAQNSLHVLLVEDDPQIGAQVVQHLSAAGFTVEWITDGERARDADFDGYQIVILDVMLPTIWGTDVLKTLRQHSDVPVLMLSARDGAADKVRALQLGADDYMSKPFYPAELVERVRARLRRPVMAHEAALTFGPLRIGVATREVTVNEQPVELTRAEFDVLAALAQRSGQAITRQWIMDHVLDSEQSTGSERTLDVHISRLRKKLEPVQCIRTVWGIGYRFSLELLP